MKVSSSRSPQYGFILIEALLGFVIFSFGMLALVGMQMMLSHNADISKQRTEAMRLAQERMETIRSFTHIVAEPATPVDPDVGGTAKLAWNDLRSGSNASAITSANFSNANFHRNWTIGGAITDPMRPVTVTVGWTDRTGQAHSVVLQSIISQSDPVNAAALGFPLPNNTNLKLPKNRNINIPVPSISLGGGKSAYQLSSNLAVVFSDLSGNVVEKCTSTVTAETYANQTAQCVTYDAYIVAGYVSGNIANSSTPVPTRPTGVNTTGITQDSTNAISCSYAVAKNVTTSSHILTSHYYLCLIPVAQNGGTWSGIIRLGGVPTDATYKVCRFEYPGKADDSIAERNNRNIQPYHAVNASLDNQNYYIDNSTSPKCPTVDGLQTILHQDCRRNIAPSATTCPATENNTPL